ncbi:TrkA family potassium uptake protein [bacterium]|nr:TrkA family potassium uptake protein [candidate division CSSED10-310 bacterium]
MFMFIAGGGVLGRAFARDLMARRHEVLVVDIEKDVCESIYARLGIMTINGNATDIDLLEEAGLHRADVAVGLMRNDADNLAFAILARHFKVPRIFVRMRNPKYEAAYRLAGVEKILNIVGLYLDQLILEVEQPDIKRIASFGAGKALIAILRVPADCRRDGMSVAEIAGSSDFPRQCILSGIYREAADSFIIPRGDQRIQSGDQLFVAADVESLRQAAAYFGISPRKLKKDHSTSS